MYLFANMGRIALANSMILQAEAFFIAAISLIPALPNTFTAQYSNAIQSTSSLLVEYVENVASTLLLMPGHPEHGPFYLILELFDSFNKWTPWSDDKNNVDKIKALLAMFKVFATFSQREFPYLIRGVSSNDQLYGQSNEYSHAVSIQINKIGSKILGQIKELKSTGRNLDAQAVGSLSLDYLNIIVDFMKVNDKTMKVIMELNELIKKTPNVDKKYLNNTMDHIANKNLTLWKALQPKDE